MKIITLLLKITKYLLMAAGVVFCLFAARNFLSARVDPGGPASVPFQTSQVKRGDVEITVSSTGTLAAVGTVEVGTQVSGTIAKVLVDYNDRVKKGQTLAVLDTALFEAAVSGAKASLEQAQAKLNKAQAEYGRNLPLLEKGHLSAQEFLTIETDRDTAKGAVLSAQADLKRAMTNLDYARISSPIDGTVIERSIEEGQTVAASYSTPTLFLIAEDLSRMQIEADVDESDIGQIKQGQKVRFTVQAYPDKEFSGAVVQIRLNPRTVSNVVTYTVVVDAANESGVLLPGMTATLDFLVAGAKDVLLAPNAALRYAQSQQKASGRNEQALCILESGAPPRTVAVQTGITDGAVTEVSGGSVQEGAQVITGMKSETEQAAGKTSILSKLFPRPPRSRGGRM